MPPLRAERPRERPDLGEQDGRLRLARQGSVRGRCEVEPRGLRGAAGAGTDEGETRGRGSEQGAERDGVEPHRKDAVHPLLRVSGGHLGRRPHAGLLLLLMMLETLLSSIPIKKRL